MDLSDGRASSFEALLRWPPGHLPYLRPDEVVALAEEAGLATDLGSLVLEVTIEDLARWQDDGVAATVAVNVSALQLSAASLVPNLVVACESGPAPPPSA